MRAEITSVVVAADVARSLRTAEYGDLVAEVDTQGLGNPTAARVEDES